MGRSEQDFTRISDEEEKSTIKFQSYMASKPLFCGLASSVDIPGASHHGNSNDGSTGRLGISHEVTSCGGLLLTLICSHEEEAIMGRL